VAAAKIIYKGIFYIILLSILLPKTVFYLAGAKTAQNLTRCQDVALTGVLAVC